MHRKNPINTKVESTSVAPRPELEHRTPRLFFRRVQMTLDDVAEHASTAASALSAFGIKSGDLVKLDIDDSAEAIVCFFALAALDARILLGSPGPSETSGELEGERFTISARVKRASSTHLEFRDIVRLDPGPSERIQKTIYETAEQRTFTDLMPEPWINRADGLILLTSGSSGSSKRVPRQPRSFLDNLKQSQRILKYCPNDVVLTITPLNHQYGLSVVLHALLVGADLVVGSPWRVSESIRFGRRHGATVVEATPEVYLRAVDFALEGKIDNSVFSLWRQAGVGGSPIDASILALVRDTLGLRLCDGYGSTEVGNIALADPDDPDGGLLLLECFKATIYNDAGEQCPPGELGLLTLLNIETGQVWESGDLASFCNGRLRVVGRANAVHRRGLVVYPAAIEERLKMRGIPALVMPYSSSRETRIVAVVEDRFRRGRKYWWNRVLAVDDMAELPDSLLCVDRIPRLPQGKPDRIRLRNALMTPATPTGEQEKALMKTAQFLRRNRQAIVDLLSSYQTQEASEIEVDGALAALDSAAVEVALENPLPVENSWVYMPSNVVLYSYVLYGLIPSVWTEEITLRPSSRAMDLTEEIHALLSPVHGLNIKLTKCSQADFAALRTERQGLIVFTGKYENTAHLAAGLEPGQVMAFFGQGTNPIVVGLEADISVAAADTAQIRLLNGGQDCFGPDLIFVHTDHLAKFLDELAKQIAKRAVSVETAPMLEKQTAHKILCDLWDVKERIWLGGNVQLSEGLLAPTVCLWQAHEKPTISEVFAPVFNIVSYSDEKEIITLLSEDHYRLRWMGAALYGVSDQTAMWFGARMTTALERSLLDADDPKLPMGGLGAHSSAVHTVDSEDPQPILLSRVVAEYGHLMTAQSRISH